MVSGFERGPLSAPVLPSRVFLPDRPSAAHLDSTLSACLPGGPRAAHLEHTLSTFPCMSAWPTFCSPSWQHRFCLLVHVCPVDHLQRIWSILSLPLCSSRPGLPFVAHLKHTPPVLSVPATRLAMTPVCPPCCTCAQLTFQIPTPATQALKIHGHAFVNGGNNVLLSGGPMGPGWATVMPACTRTCTCSTPWRRGVVRAGIGLRIVLVGLELGLGLRLRVRLRWSRG